MDLSNRLKMVAACVDKSELLVDVGTDHAYLPIFLHKNGIIKKAVATDISKGSCEKARINIAAYCLSDSIEARCGDGLKTIREGEVPACIVIAGMGGMLAIEVLKNSPDIVNNTDLIVLQVQRDIDKVRRYIHDIGFKITEENAIIEDGKFYNVLKCKKGEQDEFSECEYLLGKYLLERKNTALLEYVSHEMIKVEKALCAIENMDEHKERKIELENKRALFEEGLKWLKG